MCFAQASGDICDCVEGIFLVLLICLAPRAGPLPFLGPALDKIGKTWFFRSASNDGQSAGKNVDSVTFANGNNATRFEWQAKEHHHAKKETDRG